MDWRGAVIATLLLVLAIGAIALSLRDYERRSAGWLAAFIVAVVLTTFPLILHFAMPDRTIRLSQFPPLQMSLYFGPLLFFHASTLMNAQKIGKWLYWLIPGTVYWFYQIVFWLAPMPEDLKTNFALGVHRQYVLPIVFAASLVFVIFALYQTHVMRRRYLVWLENQTSNTNEFDPVWLKHLLFLAIPILLVWVLENFVGRLFNLDVALRFWGDALTLLLILLVVMEALTRLAVAYPKMNLCDVNCPERLETPNTDQRAQAKREGKRFKDEIIRQQLYLDPHLSLKGLARQLGTNQSHLSRSLNHGLGQSFSDVINGLRVDHAIQLIRGGEHRMYYVSLECGFGSKASFHRAFQKHAGCKPKGIKPHVTESDETPLASA